MVNHQPSAAAPFAKPLISKTVIMRLLRDMLAAMRSNLAVRNFHSVLLARKLTLPLTGAVDPR